MNDQEISLTIFGSFLAIYGLAVIIKPKLGNWGSLNDLAQKKLYGEKGYYFIIHYISGPILLFVGLAMLKDSLF